MQKENNLVHRVLKQTRDKKRRQRGEGEKGNTIISGKIKEKMES